MCFLNALTFDDWLRIVSTLSTLAIGIAAWFLSCQQFRISKSKLKFDLYEKRLSLFHVVRDFASTVALGGEWESGQLYRNTIERYFLFEKDVCDYIDEMYEKAKLLERTKLDLDPLGFDDEEKRELSNKLVELKTWFFDQSDTMLQVFSNDLSIKTLR
jgi:hypothetical protein